MSRSLGALATLLFENSLFYCQAWCFVTASIVGQPFWQAPQNHSLARWACILLQLKQPRRPKRLMECQLLYSVALIFSRTALCVLQTIHSLLCRACIQSASFRPILNTSQSSQSVHPLQLTHGFHFLFLTAAIYSSHRPQSPEVTESKSIPWANQHGRFANLG